ncbi:antiterminator Q family protein [Escherichia coli]|nr:antiterminator Q family protein [Escherichia coli]MCV5084322.1 antiterminator Q family protein [Escherichia coli]MCV5100633.1 antiterminator Q family protein [Escherichia coli]MCV5110695.1 antiterminator Q family protein [Escherichia coli]
MCDMYDVLDRWGAWAAADNSGVDWQPIAAGFKGLLPHGKKSRLQCNDDDGLLIDRCIASLGRYRPELYELIIVHFVIGLSLRGIAKRYNCSDGNIRKNMKLAIGIVEGMMLASSEGWTSEMCISII